MDVKVVMVERHAPLRERAPRTLETIAKELVSVEVLDSDWEEDKQALEDLARLGELPFQFGYWQVRS